MYPVPHPPPRHLQHVRLLQQFQLIHHDSQKDIGEINGEYKHLRTRADCTSEKFHATKYVGQSNNLQRSAHNDYRGSKNLKDEVNCRRAACGSHISKHLICPTNHRDAGGDKHDTRQKIVGAGGGRVLAC